jgi:hypothetical protein
VAIFDDPDARAPRFEWPIRVGVLDDAAQQSWVANLEQHWYHGQLYQVTALGRASRACVVLVLEGSFDDAAIRLRRTPLRAELVLLITDAGLTREQLGRLRQLARAPAAATIRRNDPSDAVIELVEHLSHDDDLESALEQLHAQVLGCATGLRGVQIRTWAEDLIARVQQLVLRPTLAETPIRLAPALAARLGVNPIASVEDLHAALEQLVRMGGFAGESHEATTIGLAGVAVAEHERLLRQLEGGPSGGSNEFVSFGPGLESAPASEAFTHSRHLQARANDSSGEQVFALTPNTVFEVEVRVGPPSEEWLGLAEPMPTPSTPPPDPRGWPLRVILWDRHHASKPIVEQMFLPEIGASKPVSFRLETSDEVVGLACRITILYDNQVLQTGILRVPSAADARDKPSFVIDAAPQPVLAQIDQERFFDASLVLNHDEGGTGRATLVQDEVVAVVPLESDGLQAFVSLVDRYLSAIVKQPDDYEGLRAPGTVELLRKLAISGAGLHRRLLHDGALDPERFSGTGPLQVTASRADAFFPVEFLYRWGAPNDDAKLCDAADDALSDAALERGVCSAGCTGQKDRVCPLGFWGLSRVIERHTFRAKDARSMQVPFELRASELSSRSGDLQPLTRALVGASDLASKYDTNAVSNLVAKLHDLVPEVHHAMDWNDWVQKAGEHEPSLLVLLPHHETRASQDFLHLGKQSELLSTRIDEEHVGRAKGVYAPIVLLIGCQTTFAKVQFDDFVSAFRFAGAKVIVSTVATILGRHAAPATERLAAIMFERTRSGPIRVGEVMLAARRSLLAQGMPMALGLTAYGDADWRLAATAGAS